MLLARRVYPSLETTVSHNVTWDTLRVVLLSVRRRAGTAPTVVAGEGCTGS